MADRKIKLKCYHPDCTNNLPLEMVVDVPQRGSAPKGTKQKLVYCARNHPNLITLPDTWNVREPVLGDEGVVGSEHGVPVLQGSKG